MTFAGFMRKSRIVRWVHRAVAKFVLPGLGLALIFATIAVTVSCMTVSYRTGQGAFCRSQATPVDKLIAALEGTSLVRDSRSTSSAGQAGSCWKKVGTTRFG